jgi:hypothetical protein
MDLTGGAGGASGETVYSTAAVTVCRAVLRVHEWVPYVPKRFGVPSIYVGPQ